MSEKALNLIRSLQSTYAHHVGVPPDDVFPEPGLLYLSALTPLVEKLSVMEVLAFLYDKAYIVHRVRQRRLESPLFRRTEVLVLYFLVSRFPCQTRALWEEGVTPLRQVFSDLGIAYEGF